MKKLNILIVLFISFFFCGITNVKGYNDSSWIDPSTNGLICYPEGGYFNCYDPRIATYPIYTTQYNKDENRLQDSGFNLRKEDASSTLQGYSKTYYSISPRLANGWDYRATNAHIREKDGEMYKYVALYASLNRHSGMQDKDCPYLTSINITEQEEFKQQILLNYPNYEIVDVFHLGTSEEILQLFDQNGNAVDESEADLNDFIENYNTWKLYGGFLPISKLTLNENIITFEKDDQDYYYNNAYKMGLNIKHRFQSNGVWSTRVYIPYIIKVKIGEATKVCQYDEGTNTYYGWGGQPITYPGGDMYGAANEEEFIQAAFVQQCLCYPETHTKVNTTLYNELKSNNKLSSYALNEYNKYCPNVVSDPTGSNKSCPINVTGNECTGKLVVEDDHDCIFNDTINTVVADENTRAPKKYTTAANEYCNISCAEKIEFEFPTRIPTEKAGTYYKLSVDAIKAKGTRTCKATLDMSHFNSKVRNELDSSTPASEVLEKIISFNGSEFEYIYNSDYSYLQQNQALKQLYDSIQDSYLSNNSFCCSHDPETGACTGTQHTWNYTIDLLNGYNFKNGGTCRNNSTTSSSNLNYNSTNLAALKEVVNNAISETANNIENELDKLEKCTASYNENKASTYDFSPNITFSYEEPYSKFFVNKNYKKISYSYPKAAISFNQDSFSYYTTDGTPTLTDSYDMINISPYVITTTDIKEITSYTSPILFYTVIPSGEIVAETSGVYRNYNLKQINSTNKFKLNTNSYDVYPIALTTSEGEHRYDYKVSKLGDSSITTTSSNPENETGRMDKLLSRTQRDYFCYYDVKQDINRDKKPNFFYRNISLNNFDPNDRAGSNKLGKNWQTKKAKDTLKEITREETSAAPESAYETPEYHFKLSPENMLDIRSYNADEESNGGYSNFKMRSYDANVSNNNDNITDVWHISEFLNDCANGTYAQEATLNGRNNFEAWTTVDKSTNEGPAWK